MDQTTRAYGGMVVAPHHLAAEAGKDVLRDGGNAIEAMIAAAAAITVVYPHMNAMGGDNFWLIHEPGRDPVAIDACGGAAGLADIDFYSGHDAIPSRGPLAALTVAGAVSGWQEAIKVSTEKWGGKLPLSRLLADALTHAEQGIVTTNSLAGNIAGKRSELEDVPGFAETYLPGGNGLSIGDRLRQEKIVATLRHLIDAGLDDFYRGDLARANARDLEAVGSPLRLADLERHHALNVAPLSASVAGHKIFNMPPPTQGLASLMLLGIFSELAVKQADDFDYVHAIVEASKAAFRIRDRYVTDPDYMTVKPADYLNEKTFKQMATGIDPKKAAPWPDAATSGDTVWLGAVDNEGRAVSFIQSLYWEFGSGVILPGSGITWQNRGTSFSLDPNHHNSLKPHRRPFHTIQPALAHLSDGRVMPYGTMGGEGQPQTQAMVFSRHVMFGQDLQQTINAPRWLLGRTWGAETTNLRIENRIGDEVINALKSAGHDVEVVGPFDEVMGHAGALVHHPDGLIEGASDPRSDGQASAF